MLNAAAKDEEEARQVFSELPLASYGSLNPVAN